MPFYRIDITLRSGNSARQEQSFFVFRQYSEPDIEKVWHKLESKSQERWGQLLKAFNVIQISRRSADYQLYLAQLQGKNPGQGRGKTPGQTLAAPPVRYTRYREER